MNIVPVQTVKFPPKIMVWEMMSGSGLSELHFVPLKQLVNAEYYINEILEKSCLPSDTTENVSLDVRGHFYAGWGSCPYR